MKTRLKSFQNNLEQKQGEKFNSYAELHQYSVTNLAELWQSIAEFFEVKFFDKPTTIIHQGDHFIDTKWFVGATLSYTHEVFKHFRSDKIAIYYSDEEGNSLSVSWPSLLAKVKHYQKIFEQYGLKKGDRVAGYVLNRPDTVAAFLATNALGAIWASCPPEFGETAVQDRFELIEPKLLVAHTRYTFRGKRFDRSKVIKKLENQIASIEHTIILDLDFTEECQEVNQLEFEKVAFDHPIWILFSSGTTGKPKAITHRTGGMILEHCKALGLHQNVAMSDRYFWYSTTGWMMYNYSLGALLLGATLCLYHGDSFYPHPDRLWEFAREFKINHFGHGSVYYSHLLSKSSKLSNTRNQPQLKSIGATGSVLHKEVASALKTRFPNTDIISLSGGTDVCSAFLGGLPGEKSVAGELQCKLLGAAVEIFDEKGEKIIDTPGELVLTTPLISMPIYFWNDTQNSRYFSSYYADYENTWRHGDWAEETSRGSFIIYGRSDATLNRHGVRIGTAEIDQSLKRLSGVEDSLILHLNHKSQDELLLFVKTDKSLSTQEINRHLKNDLSPRHQANRIWLVKDLPYTLSGKKLEIPIRKILEGQLPSEVVSLDALRNPEAIQFFIDLKNQLYESNH